jgi:hypothetical protein
MKKLIVLFSVFIFTAITTNAQRSFVEKTTVHIEGFLCDYEEYIHGEAIALVLYHIDKDGNVLLDCQIVQGGEATGSLGSEYRWIGQIININEWLPYPLPSPESYNGAYNHSHNFTLRLICKGNKNDTWMYRSFINVVYDPNAPKLLHINSNGGEIICK